MAPKPNDETLKTEDLAELIRQIRERVAARYPGTSDGGAPAPAADLTALLHARDAAEAKVAAIGSVNPRPPGPLNSLIQSVKRAMARSLGWFVRDQVVFNREIVATVEATMEALNQMNRAIGSLAGLHDIRSHWAVWHAEWERKLAANEMQFLRSVADLQTAFQHRVSLIESNFREMVNAQHRDYLGALDRANLDIQKRLWADLERVRVEYEALIHTELRILRQRAAPRARAGTMPVPSPASEAAPAFDYGRFPERFRGTEEHVKSGQRFYLPYLAGCKEVLDIGCGRGEFLELLREAGVPARGIDLSPEAVELCRGKGLQAEVADLFVYLDGLDDGSLDGIFSAQVVEHLPSGRVPEMIRLAGRKLARGGVLAIETPNPACLAIFATHFYLDPTHTHPLPYALLEFYIQECGFGRAERRDLSPAVESFPELAALPEDFRNAFFGGLDYAIIARKQ